MKLTRRDALLKGAALTAGAFITLPATHPAPAAGVKVNEDGLHVQPWFASTFLDLKEDLAEAAAAGKRLAIIWEQRGCPYCAELHKVNFADPEITAYIKANFMVVQLNFYGAREVTDFDGKKMDERQIARRWGVNFTPTVNFFPANVAEVSGKSGKDAEIWRLQGYWKPFHFHSTFVYVKDGGYKAQPEFQRWLSDYADKLRAEGKEVKLW